MRELLRDLQTRPSTHFSTLSPAPTPDPATGAGSQVGRADADAGEEPEADGPDAECRQLLGREHGGLGRLLGTSDALRYRGLASC